MAERTQKQKQAAERNETVVEDAAPAVSEAGEKLKADLDDLLDEIDDVLETNAEEFVESYGGRVHLAREVQGWSTTSLLERLSATHQRHAA